MYFFIFQFDIDYGIFEFDEEGECFVFMQFKREVKVGLVCCQYIILVVKGTVNSIDGIVLESGSSDIMVIDLVGMDCEVFDILDDILNIKDFFQELKEFDVEFGMLSCEMWEEIFIEVLFLFFLVV